MIFGLRDPGDRAQPVWSGVLWGLAVVSKWRQSRVIKPAGTVNSELPGDSRQLLLHWWLAISLLTVLG